MFGFCFINYLLMQCELLLPSSSSTQKVPLSPGPSSGKVAQVRQPVAQVAITPGGNKVMVQPRFPQPPRPTSKPLSQQVVRAKAPVRPATSPAIRHQTSSSPSSSPIVSKSEVPSPSTTVHREKRKFESMK